ncbi:MAG: hypothetical protein AAGF47_07095 [Planctomycetota bacterium]
MKRATKSKTHRPCAVCGRPATRLYRVRTRDAAWRLVCDACWPAAKAAPGYGYGGTWTNRDRGR